MQQYQEARRFQLIAVAFLIPLVVTASAEAQGVASAAQLPPKAEQAAAWKDCARFAEPGATAAVAKARELMRQVWIETPRGYFAAYTMPGEKRNPFDLSPPAPGSGPRDGVVQARLPACVYTAAASGSGISVRFVTPFYRFHEIEAGWSPPLRDGVMMEIVLEPAGGDWTAKDTGSDVAILLPEQKPRRAHEAKLPAETKWTEPIPGCAKGTRWNGADCAKRKR